MVGRPLAMESVKSRFEEVQRTYSWWQTIRSIRRPRNGDFSLAVLQIGESVERRAVFSPCQRYRYQLTRTWDDRLPTVAFVGLNPSTADGFIDDPTVRRCVGFARDWGFGGLLLVNLFALRSTDPRNLYTAREPIGPENDRWLRMTAKSAELVVAAWGVHGELHGRGRGVESYFPKLACMGKTREGHPRHPLYLSRDTPLVEM